MVGYVTDVVTYERATMPELSRPRLTLLAGSGSPVSLSEHGASVTLFESKSP